MRFHLFAAFAFVLPIASTAQDGLLDPSFSGDGKVVYDNAGGDDDGVDVAVRPDGKIWVLGNSYDLTANVESILLMRFDPDGTLDNTFFGDGTEEFSEGAGNTFSSRMRLQADGSLFIGGYYINELGYTAPMVIKVDANGNPVPSFGTSGFALGAATGYRVTDLGVQSTGTIVVTLGPLDEINPAVCAVTSTGDFGPFMTQLQCSLHDRLTALQVQPDDRILITGYCGTEDNAGGWRALILALNPDLSGDLAFSPGYVCGQLNVQTDGVEYYESGNPLIFTNDTGNDISLLANGDIMVAGTTIDTTGNADVYRTSLLKVHGDNSVDDDFGLLGFIKPYVGSFFKRMLVQANTKVLAVGGNYDGTLALARFNADGTLDLPFGDLGGFTHTAVGSFSTNPAALTVQPDGRILVVGTAVNDNNDLLVARYNNTVTGIADPGPAAHSLRVFPNPTKDEFTVELPGMTFDLAVIDLMGRTTTVHSSIVGRTRMDISAYPSGMYELRVRTNDGGVLHAHVVKD